MSSPSFAATIDLAPRASARAVIGLFWVHALPLALLLATPLEGRFMAVFALAIGASWLLLRRHPAFGYGPRALARLIWHAEGHWTLEDPAGQRVEATLHGSSLILGRILILNFTVAGAGRRTRILMGDELDEDLQRRLLARLHLGN